MASGQTLLVMHASAFSPVSSVTDGTPKVVNSQLVRALAETERVQIVAIMAADYLGGGVDIKIKGSMDTATTGNVDIGAKWERQTGLVLTTSSFATQISSTGNAVPAAANTEFTMTIQCLASGMDGVVAGDMFRLEILRESAGSPAAGDLHIRAIELRERAAP